MRLPMSVRAAPAPAAAEFHSIVCSSQPPGLITVSESPAFRRTFQLPSARRAAGLDEITSGGRDVLSLFR